MKVKKSFKAAISSLLVILMICSVMAPMASAVSFDTTKLSADTYLTSKTDYAVAPGITESHITTNNSTGSNQVKGYALEVDLSNPTTSVITSYRNYDASSWGMQKVRDQAYAVEKKLGVNVVAGVNGDFYNMGTGAPTGYFVMNGITYNSNSNWSYFAILNDGTPVIGSGYIDTSTVKECIGGPAVIIKDGALTEEAKVGGYGVDQHPRTAVGITADGNVILFVADGRQAPTSYGQTFIELAEAMLAIGCVDALSLDGGGSSTFVSQHEGSEELVCRNSPCDGSERTVSTALLVCSSAKATGEFDHASLTPNNEIYTPGSEVTLSAIGVDSAGSSAPLPEDGTYILADESFGTIEGNVFTSNGKTGTVTINYITNGEVAGSTSFDIQTPDSLSFEKEELSLAFDQQSDLGLLAKYQGKTVNCKNGDFIWTLDDEKMGTFSGNTFIASPSESINGNITVKSAYDESVTASIYAIIGRQPYVIWDFEDPDYYSFATGYLAPNGGIETYLTGDATCNMLLGTYADGGIPRGAKGTAEVIDIDSGEVRLGNHALKINYDFTNQADSVIDGVCIGAYSATSAMEGTPTAVGLWLYAPEGTPNFWFRMRVWDAGANQGAGAVVTLNFTARGDSNPADGVGGINWQGWKYCEAQLDGAGPFSLLGGECVRLMNCPNYSQNGNKTVTGEVDPDGSLVYKNVSAADRKGYVYIDNVQFVYGSNTQDVDNPVIDSISVGDPNTGSETEIGTDTSIDTNYVVLQTKFHDVQNKNTTGIDYANKAYRIYIDGKNVTDDPNCIVLPGDDIIKYYATLADGVHSIKVLLRDGFGNETTQTRYFTVKGGVEYPTVKVEAADSTCVLNKTFTVDFKTNAVSNISGITTNIKVDTDIVKSADDIAVTFGDGFTGSYTYDAETGIVTLSVNGDAEGDTDWNTVASVTFDIPWDVVNGKNFSYRVTEGVITYSDDSIFTDTFASADISVPVTAAYVITSDTILAGGDGANIYVKDADGNAVANADIYKADGTLLGTTDENGIYFSSEFTAFAQSVTLYANAGDDYSFKTTYQSFTPAADENGKPSYIISVATDNASTSKELAWLASPLATAEKAQAQYAEKSEYEANGENAFATVDGISTIYNYAGSSVEANRSARINTVDIEGLKEGTEYAYRVGDGSIWSDVMYFTTTDAMTDTDFFIIGDIQAEDLTNTYNVVKKIGESDINYEFGLQVGDAVETSDIYALWADVLGVFAYEDIQPVDMIHVYGNHELMGDSEGISSKLLFGLDDEEHKYYSVEYGNVYIAVINFQETYTQEEFLKALEWLKADAAESDSIWKILTIHCPVYNTNLTAYIDWVTKYLPGAAQEAGIDAVFSGHDHAYSRTLPMTDGQVDTENGVVYYICGNTGEKSYATTIKPEYNFDSFISRSDYTAIYLSVTATDTEMTITTYDVNGSNSEIVDSYVIKNDSDCMVNGHDYSHADGILTCNVCGYKTGKDGYTGFAADAATGKPMYLIGGVIQTGWFSMGSDHYYFDDNGIAQTGEIKIDGRTYTFGDDYKLLKGALVKENNYWYYYINGVRQRGWHFFDGYWHYFDVRGMSVTGIPSYAMATGTWKVTRDDSAANIVYTFDSNGRLIEGGWAEGESGTSYYWGPNPVIGLQQIDGCTYYFSPVDTYMMVNESVEVEGKIYAFGEDGAFVHYGDHSDADENGACDHCENKGSFIGFMDKIVAFFTKVSNFFTKLFS